LPIPLTEEEKQIIKTIETIIDPKSRGKAKQKPIVKTSVRSTKTKRTDADVDRPAVKGNSKPQNLKQITLLSNQTLQIKLPEVYKGCKIEFI